MERLTDFVLRHKLAVVLAWVAVALAGTFAAAAVQDRLGARFGAPGQPAYEANQEIMRTYGGGLVPLVAVATEPVDFARLAPLGRVVTDPAFASDDGGTTYALLYPPQDGDLTEEITRILGPHVRVTGLEALEPEGGGGISLVAEILIGGVGALVVLAFVFGSPLAVVPLVIAAAAVLAAFLAVYGLTYLTDVSGVVQYIVALMGLGIAIDYSLLLVTRWREEGHDVRRAMATAGRAVALSAATVAIGLVATMVLPVPFLRAVGLGGVVIPLVSMAAVLTLLPILLATVGPRIDRGRPKPSRWAGLARRVIRFRWPALLVSTGLLVALSSAALGLNLGEPTSDSLARSGPAYETLAGMREAGLPTGALSPIPVLAPESALPVLRAVPGVETAVVAAPGLIEVIPDYEGTATVENVLASAPPGARVGGAVAQSIGFTASVYGAFPPMLVLVSLATYLMLAFAFRSLVLPLKAVLLNLLSLAAVIGALVLVWQEGHGSEPVWGIQALGAIDEFVPAMIFAFLYGLSMDYEVFILARMREEYDRTGSTDQAIVRGLGSTGRLVTSAALVLFLAFASLAAAPILQVKLFATALGLGILLDATLVRALLLPALVSVMGRWNWWLPSRLSRRATRRAPAPQAGPTSPAG
ncbi:MMPL family transporter [Nonomuraea africana]|uniref:MMPL family transporter n=1 Tax=Nonomuraea africana TaxID=46171 RepID=UPI0034028B70